MAQTAKAAVPQRVQNGPEGRKKREKNNPDNTPDVGALSLRATFARSICKSHGMATQFERNACADGVPCQKLSQCTKEADATIRYLELRRTLEG